MRAAVRQECLCMRGTLLLALRHRKSSRGTPRLRRVPLTLHGALRLAARTTNLNSWRAPTLCSRSRFEIRAPRTPPHIHPSANPPSRSALRLLVAASGGVLVRLDRPAFTPALTEIGLLYRPVSSVGLAATPRAGGICGLAASWLFSSRRQAHFPAGIAHGRVSDA